MSTNVGVILAVTAAALFATASFAADSTSGVADIPCYGINACQGKGACRTAVNDCAGKNACKGKGITYVSTEKECLKQGGKVQK